MWKWLSEDQKERLRQIEVNGKFLSIDLYEMGMIPDEGMILK
jgi:hypothetical protein